MSSLNKLKIAWIFTFLLLVTASLSPGSDVVHRFHTDIIFHIAVYAVLSSIPLIVLRKRIYAFVAALVIAPLAYLFETIHGSVTGFGFEMFDAFLNNIGIMIGFIAGLFLRIRQHFNNADNSSLQ